MAWFKGWFKDILKKPEYFKLEPDREYKMHELIFVLKYKNVEIGQGNRIVLLILEKLAKDYQESKE